MIKPDKNADIPLLGISFEEFDDLLIGVRFVISGF